MFFDEQKKPNVNLPKAPRGFLGVIGDLLKSSNERRPAAQRSSGGGMNRPQPRKPCGGCGGK
jgi:hypothetical protein